MAEYHELSEAARAYLDNHREPEVVEVTYWDYEDDDDPEEGEEGFWDYEDDGPEDPGDYWPSTTSTPFPFQALTTWVRKMQYKGAHRLWRT